MKKCPYCKKEIQPNTSFIQYNNKGQLCHCECWNKEVDKKEGEKNQ